MATGFVLETIYGEVPSFAIAHIIRDNAFDEFTKTAAIRRLEYTLCSAPDKLAQFFLSENDDNKGMQLIRYFAENSKCARISLRLGADRKKKEKKTKKPIVPTLDKSFILNLFNQTKDLLHESKESQFTVIGGDDDSRVIDLLYQRLFYRIEIIPENNIISINQVADKMIELMRNKHEEIKRFC
jgi:hypothetical protein